MAQIINENAGLGALLGQGLGTGLGSTLDRLANLKMNNLVQRQQAGAYQQLGLPAHLANALAQITPQERFDIFQRLQPEDFAQQTGMQALQQGITPQQQVADVLSTTQAPLNAQAVLNQAIAEQPSQKAIPLLARPSSAQRAAQHKEQLAIDKQTQKFYDETLAQAESAKKGDLRLNKMEALIKKGNLPISTIYNVLKNLEELSPTHAGSAGAFAGGYLGGPVGAAVGGTIGALISPVATVLRGVERQIFPDTEQFEKLSNDFVKEAKSIFGSRITDADLRAFMQTIPTLGQSDQGKRKIIENIRAFNDATIAKADALKKIIKENGGKRPANLQILVEEKVGPKLDELAKDFEI